MKTAWSIVLMLLGVSVGPLALISFIPGGGSAQLQPLLSFGGACFGAGAVAVTLAMIAVVLANQTIDEAIEKEKEKEEDNASQPN